MFLKTILMSLVAVAHIHYALASPQITTIIPFAVADDPSTEDPGDVDTEIFSGLILGMNADGATTYVFSIAGTGTEDPPMTVTLVESASGETAIVGFPDGGEDEDADGDDAAVQSLACDFSGGSADCTLFAVGVDGTETTTETIPETGIAGSVTLVLSGGIPTADASQTNDGVQTSGEGPTSGGAQTVGGSLPSGQTSAGGQTRGGSQGTVASQTGTSTAAQSTQSSGAVTNKATHLAAFSLSFGIVIFFSA